MRHTIRLICIFFLSIHLIPSAAFASENRFMATNVYSITMDTADYQLIINHVNQQGNNDHPNPTTSEDFYGATSYYNNFDARIGKFDASFSSSEEAIKEALSTLILPAKFPSAKLNDTVFINYQYYNGSVNTGQMLFKCINIAPLTFASIDTEIPSGSGGQLRFGTDSTLDIVTWNIEHFPKSGSASVALVKEWLISLDADFYALQEIDDTSGFKQMIAQMDGYKAIIGEYEYAPLCFLYKSDSITVSSAYQLFSDDNTSFPREPLVVEFTYQKQDYIIVNNHLKCCGDGILESENSYDEENRRQSAMQKLKAHIDTHWSDESVIVVGDFNDVLEDAIENNVFQSFINDDSHYKFADKYISFGNQLNWSYPGWPSDLDHILITNELFNASVAEIIKIDSILSWESYDRYISDHRPVGVRIDLQQLAQTATQNHRIDANVANDQIVVGPNPANNHLFIQHLPTDEPVNIRIVDASGKRQLNKLSHGNSALTLDLSELNQGIYLIMFSGENWQYASRFVKP